MANQARYKNPSVPARQISKRDGAKGALMRIERYESERAAWIAANPQASPLEYQKEMTAIAARHAA